MRTIKSIVEDIMIKIVDEFSVYEALDVFFEAPTENRDICPILFEEYEAALKEEGLTHKEYYKYLKEKDSEINKKIEEASRLIKEAIIISKENNIIFSLNIPGGLGNVYNPIDYGWKHSQICW